MHIHEEAGISFIDVKGGLSTKALANAITKTHADKQVLKSFCCKTGKKHYELSNKRQFEVLTGCYSFEVRGSLILVYNV